MEKPFAFHPLSHRTPQGGVAEGTEVEFWVDAATDFYMSGMSLVLVSDRDKSSVTVAMHRKRSGDADTYTASYTVHASGLYWYYFIGHQDEHWFYLCADENSNAYATGEAAAFWQLTVYRKSEVSCDWMRGRTMYHVFVDRFCKSGETRSKPRCFLHGSWGETPFYKPINGRIWNNDFFGGNLAGIIAKLDHFVSLGVGVLYLSPIFEAASNHRYDTGDYENIDPLLGDIATFEQLIREAEKLDIKVILDGVFNHTGDDSRYFNKYGHYDTVGAYQSPGSPYSDWYRFIHYPYSYHSWWGIDTLPAVNQSSPSYTAYIAGEEGIAARWIERGISGWRLDVVDELTDEFLDALCASVRKAKPDAVIIGEVWEDASNKTAYGVRRRYFEGGQLDSVMNYPVKNAIIEFIRTGRSSSFVRAIVNILDHYPEPVQHKLMNILGTHDTVRILTALADSGQHLSKAEKAVYTMPENTRRRAVLLLKQASLLQYTVPGVPCIYYGDEAGMEGYEDPFNRGCYPWGNEDEELLAWYRFLGGVRRESRILGYGGLRFLTVTESAVLYERGDGELIAGVNCGSEIVEYPLAQEYRNRITEQRERTAVLYPGSMTLLTRE